MVMHRSVIKTDEDFRKWLSSAKWDTMAFDTETTSLKYTDLDLNGFSLCDGNKVCYVDVADNVQKDSILATLNKVFTHPKMKLIIMHNAPFDLMVLHKMGITDPVERVFCTMTASYVIDENRPSHSLKYRAMAELNQTTVSYEEAEKAGIHSAEFYQYGQNDAIWTWQLFVKDVPNIKRQNLTSIYRDIEMPFQFVLRDLAIDGVLMDSEEMERQKVLAEALLDKLVIRLAELAHIPCVIQKDLFGGQEVKCAVNFNSSAQRVKVLQQMGYTLRETTDTGEFSTAKTALDRLRPKGEFIDTLIEYVNTRKLVDSFISKLPLLQCSDGRVRTSFNNTVTVTGRLSSSKPNLQNLPANRTKSDFDIRACFIAPQGKTMIAADYGGQELRILADQSKDKILLDCFQNGKDVHLTAANKIFELNLEDKVLFEDDEDHEETKSKYKLDRHKAKNGVVFPLIYGKTELGISQDFSITVAEAESWIAKFFELCPEVHKAIKSCHRFLYRHKYVYTKSGRRRRFEKIDNRAKRQAYNFLIQGTAADMLKVAMVKLRHLIRNNPQWGCKMVLTVHDEIVFEVLNEHVKEAVEQIKEVMINAYKLCVPLTVEVGIGKNYSEAK
jgi:DNA polymerase-1